MNRLATIALIFVAIAQSIGTSTGFAHDIPKQRVDRTIQLRFEPRRLSVIYQLELDDTTIAADLKRIRPEAPLPPDPEEWLNAYGRLVAPLIAQGLALRTTAALRETSWHVDSVRREREIHSIYEFRFVTDLPSPGRYRFRDSNFGTSEGLSRLGVDSSAAVEIQSDGDWPKSALANPYRPVWLSDDDSLRKTVEWSGEVAWSDVGGIASPAASEALPTILSSDRFPKGRRLGLIGAFLLGLWHTLQPGHGKTWLAAASVRASRSRFDELSLVAGWVISHFAVILSLAILAQAMSHESLVAISLGLRQSAGLFIAAPAAFRLGSHLRKSLPERFLPRMDADRSILSGQMRSAEGVNAFMAGVTAGLVPCWEAVGLLLLGLSAGYPLLGLRLVAAFIAGGVLVVVGAILSAEFFLPKMTKKRLMGYALFMALDFVVLLTGLNLLIVRST
jgi:ABC-type nickel/cobalt efflux system permease component RcnA